MNKKTAVLLVGLLIVVLVFFAFKYVTRPPEAPSQPTVAEKVAQGSASALKFVIAPTNAMAEFTIDEVLRGEPFTVVGTTKEVAGEVSITTAPAGVTIGPIRINARTLATDSSGRNGMISRSILKSDQAQFEYITFTPTTVTNLPTEIPTGTPFTFTVTGNLTIIGATLPVRFEATGTLTDTALTAEAKATVHWADFGISIPQVPFVASVSDVVGLRISFTAPISS